MLQIGQHDEQGHRPQDGQQRTYHAVNDSEPQRNLPGLARSLDRVQERFTLLLEERYQQVAHLEGVLHPQAIDDWLMIWVARDLRAAAPPNIAKQHRTKLPPLPKKS